MAQKAQTVSWSQVTPAPLMLFAGKEDALANRGIDRVRKALKNSYPELEMHDISGVGYQGGELFAVASPSLFNEPRLVRIVGLEKATDALIQDLKDYIPNAAPDVTVIIRHSGGNRGKAVLDALKKHPDCVLVQCDEVKPADRPAFVRAIAGAAGANIDYNAAQALSAAFAENLEELAATVEQLVGDTGGKITVDAVERLTAGRIEVTGFKVVDAACAGRGAEALTLYRQALQTGVSPHALLGALNMKLRHMANVYQAPGTTADIASRIGAAPWMVERAQRDVRAWDERDLARAVQRAAETEWLTRGGGQNPEFAVESLLLFVALRGKR